MTTWQSVQSAFNVDGALRDIYICPSSESLWNEFIALVRSGTFRHEFWHGEANLDLPREFREVKRLQLTDPTILKVFLPNLVQINCHFFCEEEIEMDIDPREVRDEGAFQSLLHFLRVVSATLKRDVRVTYENSPEDEIFAVRLGNAAS